MDKLVGTIVVVGLVLLLFLGVFQGTIGGDVNTQGTEVGQTLVDTSPTDTSKIGQDTVSGK